MGWPPSQSSYEGLVFTSFAASLFCPVIQPIVVQLWCAEPEHSGSVRLKQRRAIMFARAIRSHTKVGAAALLGAPMLLSQQQARAEQRVYASGYAVGEASWIPTRCPDFQILSVVYLCTAKRWGGECVSSCGKPRLVVKVAFRRGFRDGA